MWRALVLACAVGAARALSIGAVSDNATAIAPQTSSSELFPDWVPFKNKHGEDLGEFEQVETKAKPKKRLAPPVNFILRAVAEPEGDDYYEKGQGESDNEDDFEKKEWSDLNRGAGSGDGAAPLNHTDISDIDGVVSIITHGPASPVLDALRTAEERALTATPHTTDEAKPAPEEHSAEVSKPEVVKKEEEEDNEYDEVDDKQKQQLSEQERRENEAKKARILDSVDELKERHAEEQKLISERIKEEEMFKEQRERDGVRPQDVEDKYGGKMTSKKMETDYEEYDEDTSSSLENKYEVRARRPAHFSAAPAAPAASAHRKDGDKHSPPGKQSVFKNPRLYVSYDDESDESTSTTSTTSPIPATAARTAHPARRGTEKFSAKYRATTPAATPTTTTTPATEADDDYRISLVPDDADAKEGEPTMFFPKKKKSKRRKTKSSPAPPADSTAAETATRGAVQQDDAGDAGDAGDAVSAAASTVTDALPAATQHKQEDKQDNYEKEKGGGREFHADHEEEHSEHGNKAYEGYHEDSKTAKGHTDKESHAGRYKDSGGEENEHHDETSHYGKHHHEEHGKKQAKYEESGKHSKGHSTKGSHDIHKKEEYEKKVEFFEEEGDSAEDEKHGGYRDEREHETGGHFNVGNHEANHKHFAKGESGHFHKGGHAHAHKGHKLAGGHDGHSLVGGEHALKSGRQGGKKWVYHHGHPARSANLVVIDRRADKYTHGPQYFG